MVQKLVGKVAVITGGGGRIGREVVLALVAEGASVVINDIGRDAAGRSLADQAVDGDTLLMISSSSKGVTASGGTANARSLARHYAMLAQGGELDGAWLLTGDRIRIASELQTDELDELYRRRIRRGMGYRVGSDAGPGAGPRAFGHVGGGGSFGYADPDTRFAIGYVKNFLDAMLPPSLAQATRGDNERSGALVARTVQVALGIAPSSEA